MAHKYPWQAKSLTAPYATRKQPWTPATSSAYGEAVKGRTDLIVQHKKDLDSAFNYIRWHGAKPGSSAGAAEQKEPEIKVELADSRQLHKASLTSESRPADEETSPTRNIGYGSGMYAHASRGKRSGTQPTWSFERVPSLLPQPLLRGRQTCGVAPPDSSAQWPLCAGLSRGPEGPQPPPLPPATPPTPGSGIVASSSAAQLLSRGEGAFASPSILRSGSEPRLRYKGLHGVIGITWDDARRTAGDNYRGGSGEFLGF
eukprot:gb/GFBE01015605.1/.p1 GENE.gb/GFBE01015605.1/~~gb/GFBE01015605.1/.p1  ORF type:complete len:258 (+),score=33.71 gb/GFBE01015605.1/:1-774(+)